jgi:methionyl-tRNA synthetase
VTRDLDWGIDVPVEGAEGKNYTSGLMSIGYISATKEWALREGEKNTYWKIKTRSWFIL